MILVCEKRGIILYVQTVEQKKQTFSRHECGGGGGGELMAPISLSFCSNLDVRQVSLRQGSKKIMGF